MLTFPPPAERVFHPHSQPQAAQREDIFSAYNPPTPLNLAQVRAAAEWFALRELVQFDWQGNNPDFGRQQAEGRPLVQLAVRNFRVKVLGR